MPLMTCLNCGAQWDTETTPAMWRFRSGALGGSTYVSPKSIQIAGQEIEHCPKCPDPRLDDAMKTGTDRRETFDER